MFQRLVLDDTYHFTDCMNLDTELHMPSFLGTHQFFKGLDFSMVFWFNQN